MLNGLPRSSPNTQQSERTRVSMLGDFGREAMKDRANSAERVKLVQQLADFLDSESILRHKKSNCERCGSKMQYREFQFWLADTQMTWNIRLPVCPPCAAPDA